MFWFRPNDNTVNAHLDTFPMRQISHPGARSRQWTQSFPSTIIGPAALFPPSPSYSCVPFYHLYPFSIVIAFAITVILYCSLVMLTSKSGPVRPIGRRPDLTGPSQILCYIWFPITLLQIADEDTLLSQVWDWREWTGKTIVQGARTPDISIHLIRGKKWAFTSQSAGIGLVYTPDAPPLLTLVLPQML
jgi:hypothetical protein